PGKSAEGIVTKVFGYMDEPGVDLISVINGMELPTGFSDEVKRSLKKIPDKVSKKERKCRLDLRKLFTVTIDGEDTKDYDDAITLSKDKN
ncbi:MAG: ribonuclease R, partial [Eubacterium sp.]|nr:ribonuclease R [Eubacterium sp.]